MAKENYWSHYEPSFALAIVTSIIFGILTVLHGWRLIKARTWFCLPVFIGAIFEVVGFACRAVGNKNQYTLLPYILQALLILLAPILFAASVYMILGRLIRATRGQEYSIIRVNWVTKIFVGGDIFCFLMQMVGAAFLASAKTKKTRDTGEMIILIGLIIQIIIFSFFLVVSMIFHRRILRAPTPISLSTTFRWKRFLVELYLVSGLITLRNLFRVIEYAQGEQGYFLSREWPIYVLDALPMAVVVAICVLWHVGRVEDTEKTNVELNTRV
ncbi:RTA-like protein [Cadophora sp. MPI-SDFR-AT-0126]|nr:RTA-like protein [Leotiomycetes sp. MPI-SDFR-AT-0126]